MKNFLLKIFIIFFIILLQISFFNLVVINDYQVNLSIILVIAWVIIGGFEKNLAWIIALGFLNDIFFSQKLGVNIMFFTLVAYVVSFVSNRFIIERRFSGFFVIIIFIVATSFLGNILEYLMGQKFIWLELINYLKDYFKNGGKILGVNILASIYFYFIYSIMLKTEKYISRDESRLKISL